MWQKEYIPDEDSLYRRIHPDHYVEEEDRVASGAFRGRDDYELSVNWDKYTTPEKAIRKYPRHHLASLQARVPREVNQTVEHTPSHRDRSHSSIIGKKTIAIARHLARNSILIIRPKN